MGFRASSGVEGYSWRIKAPRERFFAAYHSLCSALSVMFSSVSSRSKYSSFWVVCRVVVGARR